MCELKRKVKEQLKDYSIIDLKTFIDAMNEALEKTPISTEIREKIIYAEIAATDLLYVKTENFLNGL